MSEVVSAAADRHGLSFTDLPAELVTRILGYCSIFDLCSVAMTCRKLHECAESQYIWRKKWNLLAAKSNLRFSCYSMDNVAYKDLCKRLWKVCFQGQSLPRCIHCKMTTCLDSCLLSWERKTVIDIGSKMTWLLTTTFSMRRHPTLVAVPKSLPSCCHDETIDYAPSLDENAGDEGEPVDGSGIDVAPPSPPYLHRAGPQAYPSTCNTVFSVPSMCKPVCILCNPEKADQIFSNWKHWRNVNCGGRGSALQIPLNHHYNTTASRGTHDVAEEKLGKDLFPEQCSPSQSPSRTRLSDRKMAPGSSSGWQSSLWTDIMGYLFGDIGDWQMVSPLDCFTGESNMQTLAFYFEHVLSQYKMLYEIRKPSVTFVICEPVMCTPDMRKRVASMLFEKLQVSRLCFLNKAVAVSRLIAQDTCIVVDSGANNTVVTLVIDGEAQVDRCHHAAVGGVAIAQYLAKAIEWNGIMKNVALSSLDTSQVKSNCHLSYNLSTEERRKAPIKQNIFVRSNSEMAGSPTRLQKIELGPELYLAPEMMYASLSLPEMLRDVVSDLSSSNVKDALSHIILTGGNTELKGFASRLMKDLRQLMPDYSSVINVHTYAGSRSWDAAMGASRICVPIPCSSDACVNQPGHPIWISRETYIVHGTDSLC